MIKTFNLNSFQFPTTSNTNHLLLLKQKITKSPKYTTQSIYIKMTMINNLLVIQKYIHKKESLKTEKAAINIYMNTKESDTHKSIQIAVKVNKITCQMSTKIVHNINMNTINLLKMAIFT